MSSDGLLLYLRPPLAAQLHAQTRGRELAADWSGACIDGCTRRVLVRLPLQAEGIGRPGTEWEHSLDVGRVRREGPGRATAFLPRLRLTRDAWIGPTRNGDTEILVVSGVRRPEVRVRARHRQAVRGRRNAHAQVGRVHGLPGDSVTARQVVLSGVDRL